MRFPQRSGRAFTLLEMLLVLALIGLMSGVLIGTGSRLLTPQAQSPQEVFWNAVQEARKLALSLEQDVSLAFVDDREQVGKAFVVRSAQGPKVFPVPDAGDLEVTFLSQQKGGNLIMIAGTVVETKKVEDVTFYADGTCSPFRVQFFGGGRTMVNAIDPWTCAPALSAEEARGGR